MLFTNPNLIRISSLCLCSSSAVDEMLVGSSPPPANPSRVIKLCTYQSRERPTEAGPCPVGSRSFPRGDEGIGRSGECFRSRPPAPGCSPGWVMAGCLVATGLHRGEGKAMVGKGTSKTLFLSIGG